MEKHKTIPKRRKQARQEIIEAILEIARDMMKKDGVGALSFNAIARELGVKPPSLYTYFDSKNAIYDALFQRGFRLYDAYMQQIEKAPLDQLMANIIRNYMTFAYENPDLFQIMFQRPIPDFEPSSESMAVSLALLASGRDDIRTLFEEEGIDAGIPVEQALDLMIAMMHGLASLHLANHPDLPIGEGRFGEIIDPAAQIFVKAWGIKLGKQ